MWVHQVAQDSLWAQIHETFQKPAELQMKGGALELASKNAEHGIKQRN